MGRNRKPSAVLAAEGEVGNEFGEIDLAIK
jgi:hypothetical protein